VFPRFLIALTTATLLSGCGERAKFSGVDITGADYARGFALADSSGKTRTLAEFKGSVVVVFFGYTQCPDVCPTTLADLAEVRRRMGKDGDRVQAIFVTLDPQRDTPQVLAQYAIGFDPSFIALRGSPEQTAATAREFKIFYEKVAGPTETSYTLNHTAGSYVFDRGGKVRLFIRHGQPVDAIASDLRQLMVG
jgi:protein SCO1/2